MLAGKHVLVEKPAARAAAELAPVAAVARFRAADLAQPRASQA